MKRESGDRGREGKRQREKREGRREGGRKRESDN
jgi:hypothetical protein